MVMTSIGVIGSLSGGGAGEFSANQLRAYARNVLSLVPGQGTDMVLPR
jgi:hypothetical protein